MRRAASLSGSSGNVSAGDLTPLIRPCVADSFLPVRDREARHGRQPPGAVSSHADRSGTGSSRTRPVRLTGPAGCAPLEPATRTGESAAGVATLRQGNLYSRTVYSPLRRIDTDPEPKVRPVSMSSSAHMRRPPSLPGANRHRFLHPLVPQRTLSSSATPTAPSSPCPTRTAATSSSVLKSTAPTRCAAGRRHAHPTSSGR